MATRPCNPSSELSAATGDEVTRYNGGWTKSVTGLDKSVANGYSIKGDFMRKGTDIYTVGGVYLDCDIGGSRKNLRRDFRLFRVLEDGVDVLADDTSGSRDWAVGFWDAIEEELSVEVNPLAAFSDAELVAELGRRGIEISGVVANSGVSAV